MINQYSVITLICSQTIPSIPKLLLPFFDVKIQELYTAWRVAVRRVWHVPWRTHYNMLAHIAGIMDSLFLKDVSN